MDINKEAEQTLIEIFGSEWVDVASDFKQIYIDMVLSFAERICREQREAVRKHHVESFGYTHCGDIIKDTPLLTDNK